MKKNAALGIIFNQERSHILLIKRRDVPVWVLPGGGVEENEDSEEAVKREVFEETGLEVKVIRKVGEYTPVNRLTSFSETFECCPLRGEMATGSETAEIQFFPLEECPKNLFFLHREWLHDALNNHPDTIQRSLDHINYWNLLKYFLRHPLWVIRFFLTQLKNESVIKQKAAKIQSHKEIL